MNLTVLDRLTLMNMMPKQGDFLTLSIARDIGKKVEVAQDEAKVIELKLSESANQYGEHNVTWNPEAPEKEVEFTESELGVIKKQLKQMDAQKTLKSSMLDLYKKFKADEEGE